MKTITRSLILSLVLLGLFGALGTEANPTDNVEPFAAPVYRAGEVLRVQTVHEPGKTLAFDIKGVARGLLMRETSPGGYEGEFLILPSFQDGEARVSIRELETGSVISTENIRLKSSGAKPVQITTSANDNLIVGFDETVASDTVVVTAGEQRFKVGEGLVSRSNFFEVKSLDDLEDSRIVVRARTLDGEQLRSVVRQ